MHVADEGFEPVGDEFDWPAEYLAQRRHDDFIAVNVELDPEPATYIGANHPHPVFIDAEMPAVDVLLLPGCLM